MTDRSLVRRAALAAGLFLAGSAVFAAAYGLAPLYYSNQNQYFLHGMAAGGHGVLREDWLANTADPTPVFSAVVAGTVRWLHPWAFYAYQALMLGAYGAALLGLFVGVVGREKAAGRWAVFGLLVVAAHSGLARWASYRVVGFDYPWFVQAGVAGQYVLGSMWQPSVFGVFLVAAVALFVNDRPYLAAGAVGVAAGVHSTYLLAGALLTLGFLAALGREGRWREAAGVGALALGLVMPAVVYAAVRFAPSSAEAFAEAQDVLVNVRIPHHSRVDLWLDGVAWAQVAWVGVALALTWGTRLFVALAVPAGLAAALTGAQAATGGEALALLFPWRVSAVLVPVATGVVLARVVGALPGVEARGRAVALVGVAALAAGGVWIMATGRAFLGDDGELAVMGYAWEQRAPGQVWLLPVRVPKLAAATRGSLSSDFKPLAEKTASDVVIPVNLQRFRLHGGVPIYVDFKSIPYRDVDVLEWRERLRVAEGVVDAVRAGRGAEAVAEMRRRGVTHLVLPAGVAGPGAGAERVYEDGRYQVWRVR